MRLLNLTVKVCMLNDIDHDISSPDIVDQATSQTEKTVEMRTLNRQIKLLSKIDRALKENQGVTPMVTAKKQVNQ